MFLKKFNNIFHKQIDGIGLAVFRICFFLVLFFEVKQLYFFRKLIYGPFGDIVPSDIDLGIALWFWMPICLMLVFGIFTRINTILNYFFCLVFIATIQTYEYHMFYVYMGVSFLVLFMPISQCFSIDRLYKKLKYSNTKFNYIPSKEVSIWHYWMLILHGVGFVYFGSIFFKFQSPMWMSGLGMWLPASLPMASASNLDLLLNWEFGTIVLGYTTLIYEILFIFLFWFKQFRIPLFLIGFGLHLGIVITFPLPWFGLGGIAILLLLLPNSLWYKIGEILRSKKPNLKVFYDQDCPLCVRTKTIIEHLDWFKKIHFSSVQSDTHKATNLSKVSKEELLNSMYSINAKGEISSGLNTYIQICFNIYYLIPLGILLSIPGISHFAKYIYNYVATNRFTDRCTEDLCGLPFINTPVKDNQVMLLKNTNLLDVKKIFFALIFFLFLFFQISVIYNLGFINSLKNKIGFNNSRIDYYLKSYILTNASWKKTFFGICDHGLFIESHFANYNHIISVIYENLNKNYILPLYNSKGNPNGYISGPTWAKWTFRVNSPLIQEKQLSNGIRDFTAFWASQELIHLNDGEAHKFNIRVKKVPYIPQKWEKDFKRKVEANRWLDGGHVIWENGEFKAYIKDIETL